MRGKKKKCKKNVSRHTYLSLCLGHQFLVHKMSSHIRCHARSTLQVCGLVLCFILQQSIGDSLYLGIWILIFSWKQTVMGIRRGSSQEPCSHPGNSPCGVCCVAQVRCPVAWFITSVSTQNMCSLRWAYGDANSAQLRFCSEFYLCLSFQTSIK